EPLPRAAQHAEANQLFHALRGVALPQGSGPLNERKVESAPDHRRNVDETPPPLGEPLQPPADKVPNPGREGQPLSAADRSSLADRVHHLDDDKRVAITRAPSLFGELRKQGVWNARRRERPHEAGGVGAGKWCHGYPLQLSARIELVQRAPKEGSVGELLLADGGEREQRD